MDVPPKTLGEVVSEKREEDDRVTTTEKVLVNKAVGVPATTEGEKGTETVRVGLPVRDEKKVPVGKLMEGDKVELELTVSETLPKLLEVRVLVRLEY